MTTVRSEARLQQSLGEISRLLAKHRVLETMTQKLEGPRRDLLEHLQHRFVRDSLPQDIVAAEATKAFERYDLVSAPVIDERGKLTGRLTVDAVMDVLRDESELREWRAIGGSARGRRDAARGTRPTAIDSTQDFRRWFHRCVGRVPRCSV
jgi:hypothetical protein